MGKEKGQEPAPRKVGVVLDGSIRRRLKMFVADNDVTLRSVFNAALDEYLKKRGA